VTPDDLLGAARELLARTDAQTAGLWPRASALLARQALEAALDEFWKARKLAFDPKGGRRHQLICLREYMDPVKGGEVAHAWSALSRACHHHPYELAPTREELEAWMSAAAALCGGLAGGEP
jgi:hypothetical protein